MQPRIIIVGGGYTGAISAILLARMSDQPLDIRIVEPRAELGRGLAYDTDDPAHRLNVPPSLMVLYLDDIDHFSRYVAARDIAKSDPGAVAFDGSLYVRRSLFGDYMVGEMGRHMANNPSASTINHVRDRAIDLVRLENGYKLSLAGGAELQGDVVVLATSHGNPALPPGLPDNLRNHPGLILDPWSEKELSRVQNDARLLVVGAGLTGADVVVSLRLRGHKGNILMLSRHGLPPNRQHDFGDINVLLERIRRPVPDLIERHGEFAAVRQVVRSVRRDVSEALRSDPESDWRDQFDHVRDAFGVIWRNLPIAEKRRYTRHLASYYGSHRNRVAPQVVDQIVSLQQSGKLTSLAGRIEDAEGRGDAIAVHYRARRGRQRHSDTFDVVINCTGPVHRPDEVGNPVLDAAAGQGLIRADGFGLGIDVDGQGCAVSADGRPQDGLYVAGPLSRGFFGDIIGVPQITAQLHTILPAILRSIE